MKADEGERLEFKAARSEWNQTKLNRYCVALANELGGKLILGVSDAKPRKVVGSNAFRNLNDAKSKVFDKLHIRVDAEEIAHPDGRVLVFHIPSRPIGTPLHCDGEYLMRVGEDLVSMSPDQLRKIFDEGKPDFLSQIARDSLSGSDVISLLDTQTYFDLLKLPYPSQRSGVLARFEHENLIVKHGSKYNISNLGALLFAKDIKEFRTVAPKAPRVVAYKGKGKLKTSTDRFAGRGYVYGFENLIEYINTQLPPNILIGKAFREEHKMFPDIAVRELVANALIHQDFREDGMFVTVEIYDDRMEISNPGVPPIATDRLIDADKSRNESLADLMRRLRICERQGSGIDKVIVAVEAWQLPAPDFRAGEREFSVVLFSHADFEEMSRKDKVRACFQHCVLKYVMNEKMTNQSLRERFDLSEAKSHLASRVIRDTLDANMIKLDDPESTSRRYSRYVPYWA